MSRIRSAGQRCPLCPRREPVPAAEVSAEGVAWKSKPSWHVLAAHDRVVHPYLQRWASGRIGVEVTEMANNHVPMLSQPDVVLQVIRKVAAGVR